LYQSTPRKDLQHVRVKRREEGKVLPSQTISLGGQEGDAGKQRGERLPKKANKKTNFPKEE